MSAISTAFTAPRPGRVGLDGEAPAPPTSASHESLSAVVCCLLLLLYLVLPLQLALLPQHLRLRQCLLHLPAPRGHRRLNRSQLGMIPWRTTLWAMSSSRCFTSTLSERMDRDPTCSRTRLPPSSDTCANRVPDILQPNARGQS